MPLAMLGWEYTRDFWVGNWYLPVIFLLVMAVLNTYFLRNWKLFSLLEKEEWGGIIGYVLERMRRGVIRRSEVKIGINAALVSSRVEVIGEIEQAIRDHKPALMKEFALSLGIPRLLRNEPAEAESYYREFLELESKEKPWIIWSYGFALLLQRKLEEAKVQFLSLSSTKEPVLLLLSAYMLDTCAAGDDEAKQRGQGMAESLRSRYDRAGLQKEADKAKTQIHVVILSKVVDEALDWLYPAGAVS